MNWPTLTEVEAADLEQLRTWQNGLPGCSQPEQRVVIKKITERIVAAWPKQTRKLIPVEVNACGELPRPKAPAKVSQPTKPIQAAQEPAAQGSFFFRTALNS